jgi:hypothetical protein
MSEDNETHHACETHPEMRTVPSQLRRSGWLVDISRFEHIWV